MFEGEIKVKATFSKGTRGTWRYNFDDNDYGISGSLYIKKQEDERERDIPEVLLVRVKGKK